MAGVIRVAFARVPAKFNPVLHGNKASATNFIRCISGNVQREGLPKPDPKPKPWPYRTKSFNMFYYLFDRTTARLDENSKIIVVDGPIASGKSAFAKELAADLGMFYMPEANLDMLYTNSYGYNCKKLDEQLPPDCKSFDVDDFCRNPKHRNTACFQLKQYSVKFAQYIDALAHLLSTGQGIVLDRSCYSDFVFTEAMYKSGYMSRGARSVYYDVRKNTIDELMAPHLIVYLDVPVSKVMENVEKRAIPYEKGSQIFNEGYLTAMDDAYKKCLTDLSKHSELLIYDWSEPGESEIVIEDIERIDFNRFGKHDPKMKDWRLNLEEEWAIARYRYCRKKEEIMTLLNVPRMDVPELVNKAEDMKILNDVWNAAPGNQFEHGYNSEMGDSGILTKMSETKFDPLPLIDRNLSR